MIVRHAGIRFEIRLRLRHTHTHAHKHTHTYALMHTYTHRNTHTYTNTRSHMHSCSHVYAHKYPLLRRYYTHTCTFVDFLLSPTRHIQTHIYVCTHLLLRALHINITHAFTHTNAYTHTLIHVCKRTHSRTCVHPLSYIHQIQTSTYLRLVLVHARTVNAYKHIYTQARLRPVAVLAMTLRGHSPSPQCHYLAPVQF